MTYLFFKDSSKYAKIPYTLLITTFFTKSIRDKIIVEFSNIKGNLHTSMPLEYDLLELEKDKEVNKDYLDYWKKFRKDQKRKEYTQQEFDELFGIHKN